VTLLLRLGLGAFAVIEVILGSWTLFSPESFYRDVPTVALTPPFSEHLMRDFGSATLGIAVVLIAATIWPTTRLAVIALLAYLAFSVPHLWFHVGHLEGATPGEATYLTTTLVLSVLVPLLLIAVAVVRARASSRMSAGGIRRDTTSG
jgi:hypothetical protein